MPTSRRPQVSADNSLTPPTSLPVQAMIAAAESRYGSWSRRKERRRDVPESPGEPMTQTEAAPAPFDPNADRLREECGVFGIFGHPDAAAITALGLHALQHRGQEAAGIVSFD